MSLQACRSSKSANFTVETRRGKTAHLSKFMSNESKAQEITVPAEYQTTAKFEDLQMVDFLQKGLKEMNITVMTKVQELAIPHILAGADVAVKAKTGSGKSLAFLIPALDIISRMGMKPHNGIGVIILSPTRELAMQLYKVAKDLVGDKIRIGRAIGGCSLQNETQELAKGCNLVVGTPGRLLDHVQNSYGLNFSNLFMVVFDEADKLLEMGFKEDMERLLDVLPNPDTRQHCLFSATLSDEVVKSSCVRLRENLVKLNADDTAVYSVRETFEQGYIICPSDLKFLLLYTFIKKNQAKQKIICFMSTCAAVEFYSSFLRYIGFDQVFAIYGKLKQAQRTNVAEQFAKATCGVLIATNVAARGLDIPDVDYILQYDPPESVESYVHRAGRACRGLSQRKGTGLLFLSETETHFIKILEEIGLKPLEVAFPANKIINVQDEMEKVIKQNYNLATAAQAAFRDCCLAYANHSLKKAFDIGRLDVQKLARSFGLQQTPRVDCILSRQRKIEKDRRTAAQKK